MSQRRFAFLFGANGPEGANLKPLQYAQNDIKRLKTAFLSSFCDFHQVADHIADTASILLKELERFVYTCERPDLLVMHFSGHGFVWNGQLYLLCNTTEVDAKLFSSTAIPIIQIKAVLDQCKAKHKLLILDCCFAGIAQGVGAWKSEEQLPGLESLKGSVNAILAACPAHRRTRELNTLELYQEKGAGFLSWAIARACDKQFTQVAREDALSLSDILEWLPSERDSVNKFLSSEDRIPAPRILNERDLVGDDEIWFTSRRRSNSYQELLVEKRQREELARFQYIPLLQQPCPAASLEDFDADRVLKYAQHDGDAASLPLGNLPKLCQQLGLTSTIGTPTRAAVLAFHKSPSRFLHSALIRATYDIADERDIYLKEDIKGPLGQQVGHALRWLLDNLRTISEHVDGGKRVDRSEIPEKALRELIANAVVHRDYEAKEAIQIKITRDQVIITNPGRLHEAIINYEPPFAYPESHPRNTDLLNMLIAEQWVEGTSHGFRVITEEFQHYNLLLPEIKNLTGELVQVIIRRPEVQHEIVQLGLHVWTEAALRRYHSLREEFVSLSQVFDTWLASEPQKRGQRIRVFWLQGEEGEHRHQALMACLSGVARDRPPMYDAGMDLGPLATALDQLLFSKSYATPPLISVELSADEQRSAWTNVRNTLAKAEEHIVEEQQAYPRLIVAGTGEQAQEAWQTLQERLEIKIIDTKGRDQERPYSFHGVHGMDSATVWGEHILNRGLPITTRRLFGREDELETLTRAWNSDRCRILSLVAFGGTGKSALVNKWLSQMRDQDYLGARKVLAWSFYSQGTKENLVSADLFVSQALNWLTPDDPIPRNPWAQGLALARLIKQHRFLLVLDGLEPLQHPLSASDVGGQLTDDSIRALLAELSDPTDWKGLCVITTRVPLTDLHRFEDGNQKEMGRVFQLELENLDYQAGAALLKSLIGADARQRDLEKAVAEVKGHALAITLLGNYLRDVHNGDLARRFDLEKLTVAERDGGHARRIMASYERWLQENLRFSELALLHLIGLFDRPAPPEAMSALLADVDLNPLTAGLDRVGGDVWNRCVDALRGMGLLNKENLEWPGTLDAHPLVREHFRDELQRGDGQMWVEGNRLLFAYYRDTAPPQPTNSKDMNTLYAAVSHGCAAGLYQQVFDELLLRRVWRDRRTNYSTRRLGMTGSDLVALSNYFQHRQWTQLQEWPLSEPARILILTNAGVRLRQLGRLVEARQCFGAVVREIESIPAGAQESEDASYAAAQYCGLLVIAGKLVGANGDPDTAMVYGQRAIEFADRGHEPYFSMHARSSLAEVYFMLGDLEKANALFEEAKAIDQESHPNPPFLYSQDLFWYGYYLIETSRAQQLLADAGKRHDWGTNGNDSSLLSRAIRSLILGAVHRAVIESGERTPAFIDETEKILDVAIIEFRTAGYSDYTVRGLLERAHFYRIRHLAEDYGNTLEDLDQATFEAQRGQMELLYADILLQRLACYLDFWPTMSNADRTDIRNKLTETLKEATDLIDKLHYHRRDEMLAALQTVAAQRGVPNEPFGSSNRGSHP
jgi:tetratricopeptide (TPR) repeat protein